MRPSSVSYLAGRLNDFVPLCLSSVGTDIDDLLEEDLQEEETFDALVAFPGDGTDAIIPIPSFNGSPSDSSVDGA